MQAIMLSVALLGSTAGPISFIVELPHPILAAGGLKLQAQVLLLPACQATAAPRDRLSQRDKPSDLL